MTRWLWVWFLAILVFPVARPAERAVRAAPASSTPSRAGRSGPLAPLVDALEWVGPRRVTSGDLAGHPTLVEFWTFACINCQRTLPAMRALEGRYRGSDVRIVSIHTPELDLERDPARVAQAVARDHIEYPVALDPDGRVWDAFGNQYWPCLYLLDGDGQVRYRHVGELHENTPAWRELLARIESLRGGGS